MSALLEVENVSKVFELNRSWVDRLARRPLKQLQALDQVGLDIQAGQIVGLVGESGSGKSTLGRCIVRLYTPETGTIRFEGQDITHLSDQDLLPLRRQIQMIFQNPYSSLNPRLSVRQTLNEVLVVHGVASGLEREERIRELLELVGLPLDAADRLPGAFSGGQRQRIGIARALALKPRLLIADEPVSALDVSIQAQIVNLLKQLQEEFNLAMLFISHDLRVVRYISSRVLVMYLGRIVEDAPTDVLFREPEHPYTRILIETAPKLEVNRQALKPTTPTVTGEIPSPLNLPTGCRFNTRCSFAAPICEQVDPPLTEIAPGHRLACHRPWRKE
ncbi:MAG: oligopeptide/dipeptide ABC transporter ATP-binding protein [Chloroflexota bacterium]